MRFYKIYNNIYDYKLSASAFYLYNYLSNRFYWTDKILIKLNTISRKTGMCVNTVRKSIDELIYYALITRRHRFSSKGHRTTNEYTIKRFGGKYTMIEATAFHYPQLNKSEVYVYCAVKYYESFYGKMAFPSYAQLTELTGLSRTTVINKVARLNDLVLFLKTVYIKTKSDFGHNNYNGITMSERIFFFFVMLKNYKGYIYIVAHRYTREMRRKMKKSILSFSKRLMGSTNFDKHISDVLEYLRRLKRKLNFDYKYHIDIYYEIDMICFFHSKQTHF